jgi:lipopolysaccharide assembly outer membrane protein LptD (OstA)
MSMSPRNRSGLAVLPIVIGLLLGHPTAAPAQPAGRLELRADALTVNSSAQTIVARGSVRITDGRVVVTAPQATYFIRERRVVISSGVSMTAPDGTLRSRTATVFLGPLNTLDRLDAQGGVVVRSGPRALTADRLVYVLSTERLTATGTVRLAVPTGMATGRSLVADLRVNTGTLTPAQIRSKEGTISGDRLDVDNTGRQGVLRGHVSGTFGTTRLTSEAATVYEREKKIVFRGKVRIARPGRVLLADTVTFYYTEDRLVAEGQTRILIQETP